MKILLLIVFAGFSATSAHRREHSHESCEPEPEPLFKDCSSQCEQKQCSSANFQSMVGATRDVNYKNEYFQPQSDPLFVKFAKITTKKSCYKIYNFTYSGLFGSNFTLQTFNVEQDDQKNIYLTTVWAGDYLNASGKYIDGKHKGTVQVRALKVLYNAELVVKVNCDGNVIFDDFIIRFYPEKYIISNMESGNCTKKYFNTRDSQAIMEVAAVQNFGSLYLKSFTSFFGDSTPLEDFLAFFPVQSNRN